MCKVSKRITQILIDKSKSVDWLARWSPHPGGGGVCACVRPTTRLRVCVYVSRVRVCAFAPSAGEKLWKISRQQQKQPSNWSEFRNICATRSTGWWGELIHNTKPQNPHHNPKCNLGNVPQIRSFSLKIYMGYIGWWPLGGSLFVSFVSRLSIRLCVFCVLCFFFLVCLLFFVAIWPFANWPRFAFSPTEISFFVVLPTGADPENTLQINP